MSFTDRLLLWLHIGFAIFTLGPVAVAIMATPRYIRKRDLAVLRYLYRTTRIFGVLTVGVFLFGLLLGRHDFSQAWFTAAMTLFIVAAVLLVIVMLDQRKAIAAIDKTLAVDEAREQAAVPASAAAAAAPPQAEQGGQGSEGTASAAAARDGITARTEQAGSEPSGDDHARQAAGGQGPAAGGAGEPAAASAAAHVASVERGRIVTMGGVISAIWLVILVLMVWHG